MTIKKTNKILYLLETFPSETSETFILNEINELINIGNSVNIIACNKDKVTHDLLSSNNILNNVKYTYLFHNKLLKALILLLKLIKDLLCCPNLLFKNALKIYKGGYKFKNMLHIYITLREADKLKFDLIHVPFVPLSFLEIANFLSMEFKCPYTIVFRAIDLYQKCSKKIMGLKFKHALKANQVITISSFNKVYVNKIINPKKEIIIVHSSIDPDKFSPSKPADKPKLITIARFLEKKGIEYLLDAYRILSSQHVKYEAVIIGKGKLENHYKKLIREYNIKEKVKIKPPLSQEEIYLMLKRSMIFILPCVITKDGDRDILPNVLKEAMSMQIPVITSNISGIGELVENNRNGILVPQRDSEAIADAILKLLSNVKLRTELGINARQTIIQYFNVKNEARKIADIFNGLIK